MHSLTAQDVQHTCIFIILRHISIIVWHDAPGGFWDFQPNLEHADTAYTTMALGVHTDTTYFTDPVGYAHCHEARQTCHAGANPPPSALLPHWDGRAVCKCSI